MFFVGATAAHEVCATVPNQWSREKHPLQILRLRPAVTAADAHSSTTDMDLAGMNWLLHDIERLHPVCMAHNLL